MSLLKRFHAEVVEGGAEACLPRNLPDEWLDLLIKAIDDLLESSDTDDTAILERRAIALAAMLPILRAKYVEQTEVELPWDTVFDHCKSYRIELNLELVHRRTDVKVEPATLESIFTNRDVRTWREP
jgi:hypothetical protein